MKILITIVMVVLVAVGGFYFLNHYIYSEKQAITPSDEVMSEPSITPIAHATMVISWNGKTIFTDPTGGAEAFAAQPQPDLVLITDIHGDHLSTTTLAAVTVETTKIIAPQAVADLLPEDLKRKTEVLDNNEVTRFEFFNIQAVPMYNLPETDDARHVKGRGNGYIVESESTRIYIAGDTAGTPEMRALQDIDVAFVPMNLPFTMGVEEAADAVLDFKPRTVYPFHYRGQNGLADVNRFKELVEQGDASIEVVLLDWYPQN